MPPFRNESREILPAEPERAVGELLELSSARILRLSAGERWDGYGKTGEYVLTAALQGNLTVSAHNQYALLDANQAFVLASPGNYAVQAVSDGLGVSAALNGELPPRLLAGRLKDGAALLPGGGAALREAVFSLAVLEDEQGRAPAASASVLAYSLLLRLRDLPAVEKRLGSPLVEAALAIIQEEFPFLEGVEELAQRLEVSPAHLGRVFSQKTGISPGKYITRMRVEYAKLLLQDPDATITYVAEASGFANANYFAKVFRRATGMSPSEYLESAPRHLVRRISHFDI